MEYGEIVPGLGVIGAGAQGQVDALFGVSGVGKEEEMGVVVAEQAGLADGFDEGRRIAGGAPAQAAISTAGLSAGGAAQIRSHINKQRTVIVEELGDLAFIKTG